MERDRPRFTQSSHRQKALASASLAMIAALGAIAMHYTLTRIEVLSEHGTEQAIQDLISAVKLVGIAIAIVQGSFSAWLWTFAMKIRRSGQFPPPGFPPVREMKVLVGDAARDRAHMGIALSLVLAVSGVVIPILLVEITKSLVQ